MNSMFVSNLILHLKSTYLPTYLPFFFSRGLKRILKSPVSQFSYRSFFMTPMQHRCIKSRVKHLIMSMGGIIRRRIDCPLWWSLSLIRRNDSSVLSSQLILGYIVRRSRRDPCAVHRSHALYSPWPLICFTNDHAGVSQIKHCMCTMKWISDIVTPIAKISLISATKSDKYVSTQDGLLWPQNTATKKGLYNIGLVNTRQRIGQTWTLLDEKSGNPSILNCNIITLSLCTTGLIHFCNPFLMPK